MNFDRFCRSGELSFRCNSLTVCVDCDFTFQMLSNRRIEPSCRFSHCITVCHSGWTWYRLDMWTNYPAWPGFSFRLYRVIFVKISCVHAVINFSQTGKSVTVSSVICDCCSNLLQTGALFTVLLIICHIAIAYSMRQIIKSVCVCQSVYLSVCPSASTLTVAFLDQFSPKLAHM